jgi:hypothetical protein
MTPQYYLSEGREQTWNSGCMEQAIFEPAAR